MNVQYCVYSVATAWKSSPPLLSLFSSAWKELLKHLRQINQLGSLGMLKAYLIIAI